MPLLPRMRGGLGGAPAFFHGTDGRKGMVGLFDEIILLEKGITER